MYNEEQSNPMTCATKHVLILGPGGSGKTYTARALQAHGLPAFDGDAVPDLIHFVDKTGATVPYPEDADAAWFAQHDFLWREPVLQQLLAEHPTVYLFGIADNAFNLLFWFDNVYYLKTSQSIRLERLLSTERDNPMGKTAEQRMLSLQVAAELDERARQLGLEAIDATLSPEAIYAIISP
jgi:hypothetical protein